MADPPQTTVELAQLCDRDENGNIYEHDPWKRHSRVIKLSGLSESWVITKCANRLRRRYDPSIWGQATKLLLPADESINSLYVGIDIRTLLPVFCHKTEIKAGTYPNLWDNFQSLEFRSRPIGDLVTGSNIIVHEYLGKEGALGYIKKSSLRDKFEMRTAGEEAICEKQVKSILRGHPIEPLRHESLRKGLSIQLSTIEGLKESAYALRLPRMAKITFTPTFLDLVRDVQKFLSHDNIHLHEIAMAICVWKDHESHKTLRLIHGVFSKDTYNMAMLETDLPRRDLLTFVANWPHYLRFHELFKLLTYMHPYRFVNARIRDGQVNRNFHSDWVDTTFPEWESTALEELKASGLEEDDNWCYVLPSSLQGSRLTRPTDADGYAVPNAELHQDLAIPDINMIGHPAYPMTDDEEIRLITPLSWVNPELVGTTAVSTFCMNRAIITHAGLKEYGGSGNLRLISGDQLVICAPPTPLVANGLPTSSLQGKYHAEKAEHQVEKKHGQVQGTEHGMPQMQSWVATLPRPVLDKFKMDVNDRLFETREAGIRFEDITCDDLLLPTWPEHLKFLSWEAKLKLRSVIEKYDKNKQLHHTFDALVRLDLDNAQAKTVKEAIAAAVAATKPFVNKIRKTHWTLCAESFAKDKREDWTLFGALGLGVIAPLLQLLGNEDLGARRPEIFAFEEVVSALSKKGVDYSCLFHIKALGSEDLMVDRDLEFAMPLSVVDETARHLGHLLKSDPFVCVDEFDAISKSLG